MRILSLAHGSRPDAVTKPVFRAIQPNCDGQHSDRTQRRTSLVPIEHKSKAVAVNPSKEISHGNRVYARCAVRRPRSYGLHQARQEAPVARKAGHPSLAGASVLVTHRKRNYAETGHRYLPRGGGVPARTMTPMTMR